MSMFATYTLEDGRFCSVQYTKQLSHYTPPDEPNFYGEITLKGISELTCDGEYKISLDEFSNDEKEEIEDHCWRL